MILTNRLFERTPPDREAKNIYIFCEGVKREYQYFKYFKDLDSRIKIEIYKLHPHEDNSPLGLFRIAQKSIIKSKSNPEPKYDFLKGDEVWIVLDIDTDKGHSRDPQIEEIRKKCAELKWNLARSNPCFEVWLYYHIKSIVPKEKLADKCSSWKHLLNKAVKGGFDSRIHPVFIEKAAKNAKNNFKSIDQNLSIGSTEVYNLAERIIPLIKTKLDRVLKMIS